MLPIHFGPWQTIYWWFRRLARRFLFQTIEREGREASASGGVLDTRAQCEERL